MKVVLFVPCHAPLAERPPLPTGVRADQDDPQSRLVVGIEGVGALASMSAPRALTAASNTGTTISALERVTGDVARELVRQRIIVRRPPPSCRRRLPKRDLEAAERALIGSDAQQLRRGDAIETRPEEAEAVMQECADRRHRRHGIVDVAHDLVEGRVDQFIGARFRLPPNIEKSLSHAPSLFRSLRR
jgi:hypothetical protein